MQPIERCGKLSTRTSVAVKQRNKDKECAQIFLPEYGALGYIHACNISHKTVEWQRLFRPLCVTNWGQVGLKLDGGKWFSCLDSGNK